MSDASRTRSASASLGGALAALAGVLQVLLLTALSGAGGSVIHPVSSFALALGMVVLVVGLGGRSIVDPSRVGRIALLVLGVAPLLLLLPRTPGPQPVVLVAGMTMIWVTTIATGVAAVAVARAGILRGAARWVLVVVAADALMTAVLSTVQLDGFAFAYLGLHLELVRPAALLVWGVAVALHGRGPAMRRRVAAVGEVWRTSTDVGGPAAEAPVDRAVRR